MGNQGAPHSKGSHVNPSLADSVPTTDLRLSTRANRDSRANGSIVPIRGNPLQRLHGRHTFNDAGELSVGRTPRSVDWQVPLHGGWSLSINPLGGEQSRPGRGAGFSRGGVGVSRSLPLRLKDRQRLPGSDPHHRLPSPDLIRNDLGQGFECVSAAGPERDGHLGKFCLLLCERSRGRSGSSLTLLVGNGKAPFRKIQQEIQLLPPNQ